jgi:3-oxoadipate enol-lactonase
MNHWEVSRCLAALVVLASVSASAQSGVADIGDAKLNYAVSGQGEPLVLVHGWALNLSVWKDQVRAFAPRYRVVTYDLRGFGHSTGVPDITADPADLAALLDRLGIQSAHIVGHSRGGTIALAFALAFPQRVRSLVLYGAGPPQGFNLPRDGSDSTPHLAAIARRFGLDSVKAALMRHPLTWAPPDQAQFSKAQLDTIWRAYSGLDLLEDHVPSNRVALARIDQLRQIHAPTLVLTGDHEQPYLQVVAAALAYGITGAQRANIADAGHAAHLSQPARFNQAVLAFLDGVRAGTR